MSRAIAEVLEEPCSEFEDVGLTLSGLRFEIDPNRPYQFSARIMQWRSDIKAVWLLFHNWLPGFHRRSLVLITLFSQILGFCGSYRDAALQTRRRGGKLQSADLRMSLDDQINQVLRPCLFRLSVKGGTQHSKNQGPQSIVHTLHCRIFSPLVGRDRK